MDMKLKCRHDVLAVAMALDEKYVVLIEIGKIKNGLAWHSQVKARINGNWQYFWRHNEYVIETVDILEKKRYEFEISDYVRYIRRNEIDKNLRRALKQGKKVFP